MRQATERFEREDVVFCACCGRFLDAETSLPVEIPYEEMPASFALQVMIIRKGIADKAVINIQKKRVMKRRYRFEP